MTRRERVFLTSVLIALGIGWGATMPLSKLAVSTGHGHLGLIFWQFVIGAVLLAAITVLRKRRLPLGRAQLKTFLVIALVGTVIPNSASYQAIAHLPAGVVSVLMSLIPIVAFPMAIALGNDRFNVAGLLGLLAGLAGVSLLVLPEVSLPDRSVILWIPVVALAVVFYAFESNYVAKWGTAGMDGITVLFGASVLGALMLLPVVIASGQWIDPFQPWGVAEWALIVSSAVHALVYATYVWLVGRAGPVFAVQVSYLVTGFGVISSMLLLGETYSAYIWAAMGLMFVGLFLVQPRPKAVLAPDTAISENTF
jgi:drug/metabolite transporter (DMT)-like permease